MYLHHILNTFHQIGTITFIVIAALAAILFIQGDRAEYDYMSKTYIHDNSTTKIAKTCVIIDISLSLLLIFIPY